MTGEFPRNKPRRYAARVPQSRTTTGAVRAGWSHVWSSMAVPSRLRLLFVGVLIGGGAIALWVNLVRLQVVGIPQTRAVLAARNTSNVATAVHRRPIVDRNGHILAIDRATYTLYAHPQLFDEKPYDIAVRLAPLLDRSVRDLYRTLQTAQSGIRLKDFVTQSDAKAIQALRLNGLELAEHPTRLYPNNDLTADIVGYVDFDGQGQAGVEYSYRNRLTIEPVTDETSNGTSDDQAVTDKPERKPPSESETSPPVSSPETSSPNSSPNPKPSPESSPDDAIDPTPDRTVTRSLSDLQYDEYTRSRGDLRLQLTIDVRLQRTARRLLTEAVKTSQAKRGILMVMDARDGSILCSTTYPSYNPNAYFEADIERFKNWALSDLYEPGSTFKPLNVAIALEAGAIQADDRFDDPGQIFIGEWPISNFDYEQAGGRGNISVTDILRDSSNVGMVKIVSQLKATDYHDWLTRLEVDHLTGIDLPFEAQSQLKSRDTFAISPIEPATTAFGQGLAITPIQLLKLNGILASGGQIVTPHVVRGLVDSDDRTVWTPDFKPPQQVLSRSSTQATIAMMEEVVSTGTGKNSQIENYRIAGKTGTSQKINTQGGGYSENAIVASFVGIMPVEDPRYVILAAIDEPQTGRAGGVVAAPIVRQMIEHLIAIEKIPPSQSNP